jgi:hypothetical protein
MGASQPLYPFFSQFLFHSFANQKISCADTMPSDDADEKLEEESVSQLLHKVTAPLCRLFIRSIQFFGTGA